MKTWFTLLLILYAPWGAAQINVSESIRLSGFATFSAAKSDTKTPIINNREVNDDWCFDCDTAVGLQLDADFTDHWRASAQLVKRPQDTFSSPELEQAFIEYANRDVQVKIGRLRVPLYMLSEVYYVSSAYPWLRLPISVYSFDLGLTHFDGGRLDWNVELSDNVQLVLSPFVTSSSDNTQSLYGFDSQFETKASAGISSQVFYNDHEFKMSYLRSDVTITSPIVNNGKTNSVIDLATFGVSYYLDDLHFQSEVLFSNDFDADWYAGFDYTLGDWIPYIQYGQQRNNVNNESYLIGTRFNITRQINLNLEWQYIEGREEAVNGYFTQIQLAPPIESTAQLYSIGLSFTF
ncbi:sulfate ABC transporter permease [uncultured Vibrio sp.]|uniref:sulfate ABC transporter permease n=1 Tax=uncultured Vibrio sp. TaxID=114054 RepID=UPI0025E28787|nr:sulfate ABC transporter permease [uncultured Vibrio sp.]